MTEKYISMTHKEREYQFVDGGSMVIKDGCFTAFLNYSPWLYGHVKNTCIRREPAEFPTVIFRKIYYCIYYYLQEGTTF